MPDRQDFNSYRPPPWSERAGEAEGVPAGTLATDDDLVRFVNATCWDDWDQAYQPWHQQVEENVRLLAGRQYDAYITQVGEFLDLSQWFLTPDELWRRTPVFNWLGHHYKLSLSKLTENLPSVGFVPATADWLDATTAYVMEPVWKAGWHEMEMPEKMFAIYGWVLVAARAISKLRWDPDKGPLEEYRGPAYLEYLKDNRLTGRRLTDAPYVRNTEGLWVPAVERDDQDRLLLDEDGEPRMGQPYRATAGDFAFDVVTPTSVRTPFGPEPFHEKAWYTQEYLMPVEEVERRYGVAVEPDNIEADDDLWLKLAYGQHYGMPSSMSSAFALGAVEHVSLKGLKRVREHWRPMKSNHPTQSRGRIIIVTKDKVLYDDINPFWVEGSNERAVMPFDAFDAVPVPFRQEGMGEYEALGPIAKALNRRMGGAMDAIDYEEQPTTFINRNIGISEEEIERMGRPGARIQVDMAPGIGQPAFRLPPNAMPPSMEMADKLLSWMQLLGSQPFGSEGVPVARDASGELQREVRFDTDRVWGATVRAHSYVWARIALKMQGVMAACLSDDRLLSLTGDDQAVEFVQVGPQMFRGRIHAIPQPESQVLESRQEKQNRILALVQVGLPIDQALKALNYPDLNRVLRPGGPAYAMASRENMELLLGQLPPVLPEHDHATHLLVLGQFMQTVTFRDLDPEAQTRFRVHKFLHEQYQVAETVRVGQMAMTAQAALSPPAPDGSSAPPQEGGGPSLPATPDRAPRGSELEAGAVRPGSADPRRRSVALVT